MEVTREDPRLGEISEGASDISQDGLVWRLLVKIHDLARYRKAELLQQTTPSLNRSDPDSSERAWSHASES
ncbi:hypothetical protein RRG08_007687 [Elysia crispata]|uniref:Uncharacterized protein n=1 Tax=Elysia crispata TaxID=231223 RepID=A0AAE0YUW3_9GAST|nr:hypothetical protein RRG08_007687 [Elysia crispata]